MVPRLGGTTKSTSLAAPISLNISKGRTNQTFSVQFDAHEVDDRRICSRTRRTRRALAGINYPTARSTDPLNYGVPNLTFSNFNVRLGAANLRVGRSHQPELHATRGRSRNISSASARTSATTSPSAETNGNARGTFTFTGSLHEQRRADVARHRRGLRGLPARAAAAGDAAGRRHDAAPRERVRRVPRGQLAEEREADAQPRPALRSDDAVRRESSGQMANLDVTPDFTAAPRRDCPARPGRSPASCSRPALVNTDWNNVGPRLGIAYRLAQEHDPARRLQHHVQHAARTRRSRASSSASRRLRRRRPTSASLDDPLTISDGPARRARPTTTNNFGVDPNYGLGMIQTWNATFSRDLWRNWTFIAGYTGTKGTSLDLLRAPNRNPDGTLRIAGRAAVHLGVVGRALDSAARQLPVPAAARARLQRAASTTRSRSRWTTRRRSARAAPSSRRTIRISARSGRCRTSTSGITCPANLTRSCRSASAASGWRTAGSWRRSWASGR